MWIKWELESFAAETLLEYEPFALGPQAIGCGYKSAGKKRPLCPTHTTYRPGRRDPGRR